MNRVFIDTSVWSEALHRNDLHLVSFDKDFISISQHSELKILDTNRFIKNNK
jgi:predicted nucleic acid-binding protein